MRNCAICENFYWCPNRTDADECDEFGLQA